MPTMSDMPRCTELDKMRAVKDKSQAIGEFLAWLRDDKGVVLATYDAVDQLWPWHRNVEQLLAEFFKIDLNKAEQEKMAILEALRRG